MKKILVTFLICMMVFLGGCSMKKDSSPIIGPEDTGSGVVKSVAGKYSFTNADCQSYVSLMECLISKTPEVARDQTISSFEKVMELRKGLDEATLPSTCKNTVDMLKNQKDVFAKAGCQLN